MITIRRNRDLHCLDLQKNLGNRREDTPYKCIVFYLTPIFKSCTEVQQATSYAGEQISLWHNH